MRRWVAVTVALVSVAAAAAGYQALATPSRGVQTHRGGPPVDVVMLDVVARGTRACVLYTTTDPNPRHARAGTC